MSGIDNDITAIRQLIIEAKPIFKAATKSQLAKRPESDDDRVERLTDQAIRIKKQLMALVDEVYLLDEVAGSELTEILNDESAMRESKVSEERS